MTCRLFVEESHALPLGHFQVVLPTGSLEAYIQTVNRFPMLTAEEERALAVRFRSHNDLEAARQTKTTSRLSLTPSARA